MNVVSLFAGVGGFDLACTRTGMNVLAAVEIDAAARSVLAWHFPDARLYRDVRTVHAYNPDSPCEECLPDERVDLVCGGFPCQDLSVAGRRAGLAGLRSGLFFELARIVSELHPRWVVLENVPGLLSSNEGRDMAAVTTTLADLGFWWAYRELDAQHFGLAQRRRRVFIVGCAGNRAAPVEVLFEPESGGGDPAPGVTTRPDVAAAVTSSAHDPRVPAPGRSDEDDVNLVVSTLQGGGVAATGSTRKPQPAGIWSRQVVAALTADGVGTCGADDNQAQAGHLIPTGGGRTFQKVIRSGARDVNGDLPPEVWAERDVASTLNGFDVGDTRACDLVVQPTVGALTTRCGNTQDDQRTTQIILTHALTSEGADASEDGTGRGTPLTVHMLQDQIHGDISPALGASGDAGVAVNEQQSVRRLTPLECTRLQGFPDFWVREGADGAQSDSAQYRQLGNAAPVPVVEWVMRRIVAVDATFGVAS